MSERRSIAAAASPGMDESMADMIKPLMERSAVSIKALIEAET
ncbi:MAG: hypothetical protein O6923_02360 [Actinobacteria bacterium]|nr:hypothetical protein [Actinomycetota bacterium]